MGPEDHHEAGENILETAKRGLKEETGRDIWSVMYCGNNGVFRQVG